VTTPFSSIAFTPPEPEDQASIVRSILQLQQAVFGSSNGTPLNNLNVIQNNTPPNTALFASTSASSAATTTATGAVTVIGGGGLFF
jgi:hypothetical protein